MMRESAETGQISTLPQPERTLAKRAAKSAGDELVLDRYRLHRRLGTGGFGTVWMARDERLDRDVAVKVLPRERIESGRFEREARAAARLAHPGIVTLYEAAFDDQAAYLVSELVIGATLDQLLVAGRLSDRDIAEIGIALCNALAHAHTQGVVHRDVKPSNVLVPERPASSAGLAKLTDFGVARVLGTEALTRTGDVIGTAAYMSPEQAEGLPADASADIYALALVLYEALTGTNPLHTSTAARRARRLGTHLPPLRRQRRELPRELGQGIDRALRPRPRERGRLEELRVSLAAASGEVSDEPGIVASRWPVRGERSDEPGHRSVEIFARDGAAAAPTGHEQDEPSSPGALARWGERALGAAAAAALLAWLTSHLLVGVPVPPLAAALIAALMVAALPRIGWAVIVAAVGSALLLEHRPGGALVVFVTLIVPVALLPRSPLKWPLAVGAPALGMLRMGGAWPALAGQAGTAWRRAAQGMMGWMWIVMAAPVTGADLYTRRPPGTTPAAVWMSSLHATGEHVLTPLVSGGLLAGALVWGLAAMVLPWIARGRSLPFDVIRVTMWAATVAAATPTVVAVGHDHVTLRPGAAAVGAVVSAVVALARPHLAMWRSRAQSPSFQAGLP